MFYLAEDPVGRMIVVDGRQRLSTFVREDAVVQRKDTLVAGSYALMDDVDFIRSITYGPNRANQVRHRFEVMQRTLAEVLDA